MKKIFTLIAAALMAVGVNATTTTLYEGSTDFSSWNVSLQFSASQVGTVHEGDVIEVEATISDETLNADGQWSSWAYYPQILLKNSSWENITDTKLFDNGTCNAYTLTAADAETINAGGIILQGVNATLTKMTITSAINYKEGVDITSQMDEWGNILASAFEGYSDDAKVVFTYTISGELTNATGSIKGWGVGNIKSIAGNVNVGDCPANAIGENSVSYTIADLKAALEDGPDEYNRYGLYWNVWAQGNATTVRTSVIIYEVDNTTGISSIKSEPAVDNDAYYNLSGQRVPKPSKGLYIHNGKKVIIK